MTQSPLIQTPPMHPATPPMHPGPLGPGRPASWPSVIGIICIILAALSILGGLWGIIAPYLMRSFMAMAAKSPGGAAAMQMQWVSQVNSGAMLILAFLLLAGGIGLNARRRIGPRLLITWSILKLIAALVMAILMGQVMLTQAAAMSSQTRGAPPPALMSAMMLFGAVFGFVWSAALPIFLMIWLGLASSRRLIREWS